MSAERDAVLVRRCLDGDGRAFEEIVHRYEKLLFNVALRMTNDREDARDIAQTVFLKAWRRLDTFDGRYKFFSWIYRILMNETLNVLARRRPAGPLDERIEDRQPTPERHAEQRQVRDLVHGALMELSPDDRELIVLRHLLHHGYEEIGELLGIPPKTVKSRLYTARQRLCHALRSRGVHAS